MGKGIIVRKNIILWIFALILCIITVMGIVILRNQMDTVTVAEKYHERDAACDVSFMMWSMERDGIQYGFDPDFYSFAVKINTINAQKTRNLNISGFFVIFYLRYALFML